MSESLLFVLPLIITAYCFGRYRAKAEENCDKESPKEGIDVPSTQQPNPTSIRPKPIINPNLSTIHQATKIHCFESMHLPHIAVEERRKFLLPLLPPSPFNNIPLTSVDNESFYKKVHKRHCENVIGFIPVPLGIVGPIEVEIASITHSHFLPLATTEGALIASISRGIKAMNLGSSTVGSVLRSEMTRAPLFKCISLNDVIELKKWISKEEDAFKSLFKSISSRLSFSSITFHHAGSNLLYVRMSGDCSDAMGMNMMSKAAQLCSDYIITKSPIPSKLICLSSNLCSDKKASEINTICGRGKMVICSTKIPYDVIRKVLRCSPKALLEVWRNKCLIGSMLAGSTSSGANAQCANVVAAAFIALGQDPAQIVSSSSCMTLMEEVLICDNGCCSSDCSDCHLSISVTLPSLEMGSKGGGTALDAQSAAIALTEVKDSNELAIIIGCSVLAAEISLLSSLAEGSLVDAHARLNSFITADNTGRSGGSVLHCAEESASQVREP